MRQRELPFAAQNRRESTAHVLLMRDGLKMIRVHTAMNTALMVELQANGNWTPNALVGIPMGSDIGLAIPERPIPMRTESANPKPTARIWFWHHLIKEPLIGSAVAFDRRYFPMTGCAEDLADAGPRDSQHSADFPERVTAFAHLQNALKTRIEERESLCGG